MVSVRRLELGEGELFRDMRLAALKESPHAFGSTYESAIERSAESWQVQADSTVLGPDRATFIAFSGDTPVGISALYRDDGGAEVGEVLQVWVAPAYRGRGVAVDLMDALFAWAGENGYRRVVATIAAGNDRALAFYRKYGFGVSDETPRCGWDDPVLVKLVET